MQLRKGLLFVLFLLFGLNCCTCAAYERLVCFISAVWFELLYMCSLGKACCSFYFCCFSLNSVINVELCFKSLLCSLLLGQLLVCRLYLLLYAIRSPVLLWFCLLADN